MLCVPIYVTPSRYVIGLEAKLVIALNRLSLLLGRKNILCRLPLLQNLNMKI